jgi:predicted phosphodiesterase
MRLAVLSDTHGNLPALEAVLADVRQFAVDGVIVAGDLTGGPHPNETIALLRALNGWLIRGNSDANLLQLAAGEAPEDWYTSRQFALLRWSLHTIDRQSRHSRRARVAAPSIGIHLPRPAAGNSGLGPIAGQRAGVGVRAHTHSVGLRA